MMVFDTTFIGEPIAGNVAIAGTESDLTRGLRLGSGVDVDAEADVASSTTGRTRDMEVAKVDFGSETDDESGVQG